MYPAKNHNVCAKRPCHAGHEGGQWQPDADRQTRNVAILLSVLVLLLHTWAVAKLAGTKPPPTPKPVVIEVSLLPAPAPDAGPAQAAAPAKTPPPAKAAPPKPAVKMAAKKPSPTTPKKSTAPPKPVVEKASESLAKLAEEARKTPFEPFQPQTAAVKADSPPQAKVAARLATSPDQGKNQGVERATCISCPEPDYPALAKRRGWQGTVVLKFELTEDGRANNIQVLRSSGHEPLDQAAIANAQESRFTPGTPGVVRTATKKFDFKLS